MRDMNQAPSIVMAAERVISHEELKVIWERFFPSHRCPKIVCAVLEREEFFRVVRILGDFFFKEDDSSLLEHGRRLEPKETAARTYMSGEGPTIILRSDIPPNHFEEVLVHELKHIYNGFYVKDSVEYEYWHRKD